MVKFIYSEKATKLCEISTLLLSYAVPVKSKVEISQNFVAFSEYINFKRGWSEDSEDFLSNRCLSADIQTIKVKVNDVCHDGLFATQ